MFVPYFDMEICTTKKSCECVSVSVVVCRLKFTVILKSQSLDWIPFDIPCSELLTIRKRSLATYFISTCKAKLQTLLLLICHIIAIIMLKSTYDDYALTRMSHVAEYQMCKLLYFLSGEYW